jgi:hypothetical protein
LEQVAVAVAVDTEITLILVLTAAAVEAYFPLELAQLPIRVVQVKALQAQVAQNMLLVVAVAEV